MKKSLLTLITASSFLFSQNAFPIAKNLDANLDNIKPQISQNEKKPKRSQTNYISLETAKYFIEHFGRDNTSLRVNGSFFDTYSGCNLFYNNKPNKFFYSRCFCKGVV